MGNGKSFIAQLLNPDQPKIIDPVTPIKLRPTCGYYEGPDIWELNEEGRVKTKNKQEEKELYIVPKI